LRAYDILLLVPKKINKRLVSKEKYEKIIKNDGIRGIGG
jgi:hypothetical protein